MEKSLDLSGNVFAGGNNNTAFIQQIPWKQTHTWQASSEVQDFEGAGALAGASGLRRSGRPLIQR